MKIRKLQKEFTTKLGYDVSLIERIKDIAWYEARYVGGEKLQGYFVVKIKINKERTMPDGTKIEAHERFPGQSRGGSNGHFYMPKSRHLAEEKFLELLEQQEAKKQKEAA